MSHPKTSMLAPDPVISLAIKPVDNETPNFSRALNRFHKEDFWSTLTTKARRYAFASVTQDDIYDDTASENHIGNGRTPP